MYNRYVPDKQGNYTRISDEEIPQEPAGCSPSRSDAASPAPEKPPTFASIGQLLHKFNLSSLDTGDLLLLAILFLLFREECGKDEELLLALGLLLIL